MTLRVLVAVRARRHYALALQGNTVMFLPITLTFAAAAALLNFWLAMRIGRLRMSEKVLHGDGDNTLLAKRIRAQANYVEYTPFVLILTGAVEGALGSASWLWVLSLLYILG